MDYFLGFSNITYLCRPLFVNVQIFYCIAQINVPHINSFYKEMWFIDDYIDIIIFAKTFNKRTLYIKWIYQVIKLYTHARLFFTAQEWLSIFQYIALKANQLCATRVGKLLVSTSSLFSTYSHISFDIIIYGNCL